MADNDSKTNGLKTLAGELPLDRLKDELQDAVKALGEKAMGNVTQRLGDATTSLTDIADNGGVLGKAAKEGTKAAAKGDSPVAGALKGGLGEVKDKVKSAFGGGKGNKATKSTNIIESIDVGVPIDVAYNQWTQFQDFSGFMKKVEGVEQQDEAKLTFKAQIVWSHRTWEATIIDQVPNDRIIWRSKGQKGHVDGAVTFHELADNLTRVLVVLEYYPQGLFEKTGNIWRAQGRRARAELRHYRRHVMTRSILEEDELEGWRGEIHDGEVVRSHDEVVEEEEQQREDGYDEPEDEAEGEYEEPEDEADEESEEEYDEPEDEADEEYDDEPEDEADEESEEEYDEPEDEADEEYDDEPEDEADEDSEEEYEEPEDEADEESEEEYDDEPEDEADEDEAEEEPEERPRKRSSGTRTSSRKRKVNA